MIAQRTLCLCLITIFVSACNTQQQDQQQVEIVEKIATVQKVPEISATVETSKQQSAVVQKRPAMKLSINNMVIDEPAHNEDFLQPSNDSGDKVNTLFDSTQRNKKEPKINLSGKLFTDEVQLENKEYLQAVDGVQINIGGEFN